MEGEKKTRRPRIGENRGITRENLTENTERKEYNHNYESDNTERQHPYNTDKPSYNSERRPYNNGGYNNRNFNNNGYNNRYNNGYNNRPYNNDENTNNSQEEGSYSRPYNNNRGGGYNNRNFNNNRGGGYNNRNYNNNGYNNRYNNGYNNRPYNNDENTNNSQEEGSYSRPYNNNRGGGYNNRNYNNNRGGGYNNRNFNNNGYNNNRNQRNTGGFNKKRFIPRPQRIEYELPPIDPSQPIRLNKFLANAGICSRREADEFIQAGEVKVNGEVVTELGSKITSTDIVTFREKEVGLETKVYVLLNKPKDCVTTSDDPQGRLTVMDIVRNACSERIYPVGRLDRNTTGVLLLTNDGDLASKLTHPKFVKKKIYHVWTDKDVTEEDMQRIADGIELDDGSIHADAVSYATETDRNQIGIEIHSGRNRIVRRIFETLGYHVVKLDRVYFAGLTKKNLPRGRWRYLTQAEVNMLMMGSFE